MNFFLQCSFCQNHARTLFVRNVKALFDVFPSDSFNFIHIHYNKHLNMNFILKR